MKDISRRIKKAEKQLRIGSNLEWHGVVVLIPTPEEIAEGIPEDYKDWITYRKARAEALERLEQTGVELFMFVADPKKEYEAQQATKSDQKQLNPRK